MCLAVLTSCALETASKEPEGPPERYTDYIWRDELCDGNGSDYSGVFVNTASPRETRSFELVAALYDGSTLVDRDTEFVLNLAPGASESVEFVFGATGTRCELQSVAYR